MTSPSPQWEQRVAELWSALGGYEGEGFVAAMQALAAELPGAELQAGSDELDGAVRGFLALALTELGREREAVAHSLTALPRYLPRYNRSLARYAQELTSVSVQ